MDIETVEMETAMIELTQERDEAVRIVNLYRDFVEEHGLTGPEGDLEDPSS